MSGKSLHFLSIQILNFKTEISHALNTSKENLPARILSDLKPEGAITQGKTKIFTY